MRYARLLRGAAGGAAALLLVAATCGGPPFQNVTVTSTPTGAEIYLDGERIGYTPLRVPVERLGDHKVFLKKEGYRPELLVLTLEDAHDHIDYLTPPDLHADLRREGGEHEGDVEVQMEREEPEAEPAPERLDDPLDEL